jgi:hypothetical protein
MSRSSESDLEPIKQMLLQRILSQNLPLLQDLSFAENRKLLQDVMDILQRHFSDQYSAQIIENWQQQQEREEEQKQCTLPPVLSSTDVKEPREAIPEDLLGDSNHSLVFGRGGELSCSCRGDCGWKKFDRPLSKRSLLGKGGSEWNQTQSNQFWGFS